MTDDRSTLVFVASVAMLVLVARWAIRLSRGEWQTRRELAFVGVLVASFSSLLAVTVAEPAIRPVLLGVLLAGVGLWLLADRRALEVMGVVVPHRVLGVLVIVLGLGEVAIAVIRVLSGG